jgi:hypothetical protein
VLKVQEASQSAESTEVELQQRSKAAIKRLDILRRNNPGIQDPQSSFQVKGNVIEDARVVVSIVAKVGTSKEEAHPH